MDSSTTASSVLNQTLDSKNQNKSIYNNETVDRKHMVQKLKDPAPKTKLIAIGCRKYIKVCKYRGNTYVNIRDYIKEDTGRVYPTKRGVLLSPAEWKSLKKCFKEVDKELRNIQETK